MSVLENVAFGLKQRKIEDPMTKAVAALELVELGHLAQRRPQQLSGGQQQRLCIARTISINPEVILMDEPCSALDPIATAKIEELIDELKKTYTIVIVTHSMSQAARVSQNTGFFHLGKILEFNLTEKIFKNPDNKLTQDYITGRFG